MGRSIRTVPDRTTLTVSEELADRLYELKGRGSTYEDVIWGLLEEAGYDVPEE